MRLPNGYGSVVKLSGTRRNPYAVRKTIGYNEKGYPIYLSIGYAPTRRDGLKMLSEYNAQPWNVDGGRITFADLYAKWYEKRSERFSPSTLKGYRSAYKYCRELHGVPYAKIRTYHMQNVIDACPTTSKVNIRALLRQLDSFACEMDIIGKQYSQFLAPITLKAPRKKTFTDAEIAALWAHKDEPWVDSVLFLLYTGYRITEMLEARTDKIGLEAMTITGGIKTKAGRDRVIPIHSAIQDIVRAHVRASANGFLFEHNGWRLSETRYRLFWDGIMTRLGMKHCPHECRHTLRSKLDSAGANKVCIDRIMGHKSGGVGEVVYTHKTLAELRAAIELVTHK